MIDALRQSSTMPSFVPITIYRICVNNLGPLEPMRLLHFSGLPLHHPTPPAETDSLPRPPELPHRTELARRDDGTPARDELSPGERMLDLISLH